MLRKDSIPSEYNTGDVRVFATRMLLNSQADRYHPLDGQLVPRSSDAGLLAAIIAGDVPSCSDADWLADNTKRGMYTLGDGSTNIRLPDWNGKSYDTLGSPVIRGDGKNSAPTGVIQGDAIRNITYSHALAPYHDSGWGPILQAPTGAIDVKINAGKGMSGLVFNSGASGSLVTFDASRVVPVGPENRMINTAGVHAVKR